MQRTLLIVLVILALIAGGYFWLRPQTRDTITPGSQESEVEPKTTDEKTSLDTTVGSEIVVTYGPNGYSPATITVKKGQKVIFNNESGKQMWVASDDHPTHLIYPEFDAKKGAESGSSYEFTFEKVGTWRYHNHLNSSRTGVIIVE